MFLKEFPEETLVREVQFLSNLLDGLSGVLQQYPQFEGDIVVDPFIGCTTTDTLDRFRQMLGGDVQLLGIPAYTSLLAEVLLYEFDVVGKDEVGPRLGLVVILYPIDDVAQVVEHGKQQGLDEVLTEMVPLVGNLLLDHLEILLERLYFPLFQTHDGMLTREEEERTDVADVLDDLTEEMDGHHDTQAFHILGMLITVHDMTVADYQDIARFDHLFLGIQLVHHLSLDTQSDQDEVHASGLCRHRCLVDTFCQQEVVVQIYGLAPSLGLVKVGFFDELFFLYHVLMF